MRTIDHHIAGLSGGGSARSHDIFDPNTGQVQARVALGTRADLDAAVAAAEAAQPGWAATTIGRAHVCTPGTTAHLVCRLLLEQTKISNRLNNSHTKTNS